MTLGASTIDALVLGFVAGIACALLLMAWIIKPKVGT